MRSTACRLGERRSEFRHTTSSRNAFLTFHSCSRSSSMRLSRQTRHYTQPFLTQQALHQRHLQHRHYVYQAGTPTEEWETVIGLEIHAQIRTPRKLFSRKSQPLARIVSNRTLTVKVCRSLVPVCRPCEYQRRLLRCFHTRLITSRCSFKLQGHTGYLILMHWQVLNQEAVRLALITALALKSTIVSLSASRLCATVRYQS